MQQNGYIPCSARRAILRRERRGARPTRSVDGVSPTLGTIVVHGERKWRVYRIRRAYLQAIRLKAIVQPRQQREQNSELDSVDCYSYGTTPNQWTKNWDRGWSLTSRKVHYLDHDPEKFLRGRVGLYAATRAKWPSTILNQ